MLKVLLCDDSLFMRTYEKKILESGGCQVVGEAENGLEAIRQYKKYNPEIVIMDITMPKLDGIEATKKILQQDAGAKVIMVSAMGQKAFMIDALKAGAVDFIVKPFHQEFFLTTIEKAAARI